MKDLNYTKETKKEIIERIKKSKNGLILFCGKTNNGMTTTVSSFFKNKPKNMQ